jgi:thioredoxin reductase (NADPH)
VSPEVTLYTRQLCGLCDDAAKELHALSRELAFSLVELDIDDDPELQARFNETVPVVAIGERIIAQAPIDLERLGTALRDALTSAPR